MNTKEFLKFIKFLIIVLAVVFITWMIINSGFILSSIKIETEKFNIEIFGNEKSVQPHQE